MDEHKEEIEKLCERMKLFQDTRRVLAESETFLNFVQEKWKNMPESEKINNVNLLLLTATQNSELILKEIDKVKLELLKRTDPDSEEKAVKYLLNASKAMYENLPDGKQKKKEFVSLETLLFFAGFLCKEEDQDNLLGHLEEKYHRNVQRLGKTKAKWLLARNVTLSTIPIIREVLRNRVVQILIELGLHKVVKYFFG